MDKRKYCLQHKECRQLYLTAVCAHVSVFSSPVLSSCVSWMKLSAPVLILFSVLQLALTLALCILRECSPGGQILLLPSPPPPSYPFVCLWPTALLLPFFCPHAPPSPLLDLCCLLCSCPRCWSVAGNRTTFQTDAWDLLCTMEITLICVVWLFFSSAVNRSVWAWARQWSVCMTCKLLQCLWDITWVAYFTTAHKYKWRKYSCHLDFMPHAGFVWWLGPRLLCEYIV